MTRKQKYWICQVSGWGLFYLIYLPFSYSNSVPVWDRILFSAPAFIFQIIFTHIFRFVIIRNKWLDQSLKSNIRRIIYSSIMLAILIQSLLLIVMNLQALAELKTLPLLYLLKIYLNNAFMNCLWAAIYFAANYFDNYNRTKMERLKYEIMLKDSELQLLKTQMRPHFIFNAINSISGLINEDKQKAQTALSQLSDLLRYSLNIKKRETVPLGEEMQIVSDYLALESIRYEERMRVKIDIALDALCIPVPALMIQTLCENGVKHGISKLRLGGELSVEGKVADKTLFIVIKNSGHILDKEETISGYGIQNTKQRLNLLYGNKASFSLSQLDVNTVQAKLIIPIC